MIVEGVQYDPSSDCVPQGFLPI